MERVAKFETVSYEQFERDCLKAGFQTADIKKAYQDMKLPGRATSGSAGYDFWSPFDFTLEPGSSVLIPSGIRAKIADGYVLMIFPRSSLGFKYRLQLDNTTGIIDADYYNAANEGHIMFRLTNDSHAQKTLYVKAGQGLVQGVFVPFGITADDEAEGVRTGGFGSTNK